MILQCAWMGVRVVAVILTLATFGVAQAVHKPTSEQTEALRTFLQKYAGEPYPPFEREAPTRYSSAIVDLNGDGTKEVIVYLSGRGWCGSGGCDMLILTPQGASYRVVTETTITRLPIRVLNTKSHGWHDIAVQVAGGGIQGFEAILSFDGKTYPANPSTVPAISQSDYGKVPGKIVLPYGGKDYLLYPTEKLLGALPEGSEEIVPGQSIGTLRLGALNDELVVSWQAQPDSITSHENSCKNKEVIWFDNENRWRVPSVRAYLAKDQVYEITSEWDKRFQVQNTGIVFGKTLQDLQLMIPGGKLEQLRGSAAERPDGADELFWIDSKKGIAFGLDYPRGSTPQNRLNRIHPLHRIVISVTVFRPQDGFQPRGCRNPEQPLIPVDASATE